MSKCHQRVGRVHLGDVLEVDLAQAARDKLAINETRFAVRES